jgi:hypothetical protein
MLRGEGAATHCRLLLGTGADVNAQVAMESLAQLEMVDYYAFKVMLEKAE